MKRMLDIVVWTAVVLLCVSFAVAADDIGKTINVFESTAKVIYNGKEAVLTTKPMLVGTENYLSLKDLAGILGMRIEWNQKGQIITISDNAGSMLESMKSELAAREASIKELEEKVKKLESELDSSKRLDNAGLQSLINSEYGEYEGVACNTYISGNSDEIRVKTDVDLSTDKAAWNALSADKKKLLLKQICDMIWSEYNNVKVRGYVKDIAGKRILLSYSNTREGEIKLTAYKSYDTISKVEEMLNEDHDSYLSGIYMTYTLDGNDNGIRFSAYTKLVKYEEKWNRLSDNTLKNFMKILCKKINEEYKKCHIEGVIYDSDSGIPLASCEQKVEGDFDFSREQ